MISPYIISARLGGHLDAIAAEKMNYTLPATGIAIQRRMGSNIFACAGVSIGITNVQTAPTPSNCLPEARYGVEVGIARTCAVEFNKDGQTLNREADNIARQMSMDAAIIWDAFTDVTFVVPLINFQITGGLSVVTATFTVGEFDVATMHATDMDDAPGYPDFPPQYPKVAAA